jgi:membrane associated rhomboid family serine protease
MRRTGDFQFGFPRFTGALRSIVLISGGIWLALVLLSAFNQPLVRAVLTEGSLSQEGIRDGKIWQFFTYGFVDLEPWHFLLTMLAVYFLGSAVQERIGSRAFVELYLTSLVGAGVMGFVLSLTGVMGGGGVLGAGAAADAILMVFYMLFREAPIMLFPLPIPIPVKYIVIFTAVVEGAYFFIYQFALFYLVLLLGLASGYLWYRFMWRRASLSAMVGDRVFGIRNSYYRWKRRRAGRKFQVYMRKHDRDPKEYFDEYGNFRPPGDDDEKDGGRGGWVN